jgi:hypothetical protein
VTSGARRAVRRGVTEILANGTIAIVAFSSCFRACPDRFIGASRGDRNSTRASWVFKIHLAVVEEPSKRIYKVQIGREEQGHFVPQLPGFTKEFSRMVGATNAMVAVRRQAQTEVDKHLGLFKERIDRPLHRR